MSEYWQDDKYIVIKSKTPTTVTLPCCCKEKEKSIAALEKENQKLTELVDEGQSLVTDACSEAFTYAMRRLLGDWVRKANDELYNQSGEKT